MKKYKSLGELLIDYRNFNKLSQHDFATKVGVDVRTVQRWEKDVTLVKPDKEEDIVMETLLPYQLLRNLNAAVPIPTYYDFKLRKYSLSLLNNELPHASWFKDQIGAKTHRLRKIDFKFDIKYIEHFVTSQHRQDFHFNKELIKEAVRILPELNFVLTDDAGFYAGHCIILPLTEESYSKLRDREITKDQLTIQDLTHHIQGKKRYFFNYDLTADCNDNVFYLLTEFLEYFKNIDTKDYIIGSYSEREDSLKYIKQTGFKVIWTDESLQKELGLSIPPRFAEGNYLKLLFDE